MALRVGGGSPRSPALCMGPPGWAQAGLGVLYMRQAMTWDLGGARVRLPKSLQPWACRAGYGREPPAPLVGADPS